MKPIETIGQAALGIIGVLGTLACIGAMVLAAVGVAGVGTSAAMSGMSAQGSVNQSQPASILAFLLQAGPVILLISMGAFALSLALRKWGAAVPVLLIGGVMYWGMYAQPRLPVMYVTMVLGLLGWVVLFLWVRRPRNRKSS